MATQPTDWRSDPAAVAAMDDVADKVGRLRDYDGAYAEAIAAYCHARLARVPWDDIAAVTPISPEAILRAVYRAADAGDPLAQRVRAETGRKPRAKPAKAKRAKAAKR